MLVMWFAVGLLFPMATAATYASSNLIFANNAPLLDWSAWYVQLMLLLLGPILAVGLGYLLHRWLDTFDIKGLVFMVALGVVVGVVCTQAIRGALSASATLSILGAVVSGSGIFSAWIVLGGYLLSALKEDAPKGLE